MKDTFYFTHDYNPRSDIKIKKMLVSHGMEGYGIYWSVIEELYQNANALPTDYDTIAFDLRSDASKVKSIINDYDLFEINGNIFSSKSVNRRLGERAEKSEKARESANARWSKNANAMRTHSECNAIKERKGKEIKEIHIPTEDEFLEYVKANEPKIDISAARNKYRSWIENDWHDGNGNKIKNWKSKALNVIPYIPKMKTSYEELPNYLKPVAR